MALSLFAIRCMGKGSTRKTEGSPRFTPPGRRDGGGNVDEAAPEGEYESGDADDGGGGLVYGAGGDGRGGVGKVAGWGAGRGGAPGPAPARDGCGRWRGGSGGDGSGEYAAGRLSGSRSHSTFWQVVRCEKPLADLAVASAERWHAL